jgi:hypothetical protein
MTELAKKLPVLMAIISLTFISYAALQKGLDGVIIATVVTAIAGLGGFYLKDFVARKNGER